MPIDPQSVTVQGTPPPEVPMQANPDLPQGLSSGLQPAGGIPVSGSPSPQAAPQPAAPAPQQVAQHAVGHTFGRLLSGLSGAHNEYTIDPKTGSTVATQVKDPPGQTFRSILALGLMGGQGIGPEHGEKTFTQGLLSGLGGGVKESMQRSDMLDAQRRQQAQEQYQNQLKANQEERENKKLNMEEQLNKVAIANHNQEMAIREKTFNEHLSDRQAAGFLQSAQTSMAADAPMLEGFKSLNVDPVNDENGKPLQNLTAVELHDYLTKHPGAATQYVSLASGVQQRFDPDTQKTDVQTTYSIYPAMTKVPPALIDDIKAVGGDKPGSELYTMYKDLTPKVGQNVSANTLFAAYRRMTNWENIQDKVLGIQEKQTRMNEERAQTAKAYIERNLAQFNLDNEEEGKLAGNLFTDHFSSANGNLVNMGDLDPITPVNGQKLTPAQVKENQKRNYQRTLLGRMINAQYQVGLKDYTDHAKVYKDEYGKPITDNPELVLEGNRLSGLAKAQYQLQGGKIDPNVSNLTPQAYSVFQRIKTAGVKDPAVIQQSLVKSGVPQQDQDSIFKALGLPIPPPLQAEGQGQPGLLENPGAAAVAAIAARQKNQPYVP